MRYTLASQLAVLRSCPEVITRLLKSQGSVLLPARILVISRLLHKKIAQRRHLPPYLEVIRNRLASLRRKMLAKIDRRFQSLETSEPALVEAMCAFSLATSSSSAEVLRHFHHIRQSALSELGQRNDDNKHVSRSLRLVVKTLQDCQAIFPAQLARALETLKAAPLLQGPDLGDLPELNLVIHQRWLGEDVNIFSPYIRHDDLQKSEAATHLEQWAKNAFSTFLGDLRKMVENVQSPTVIVQLRQELLELWLSNKRHSIGSGTLDVLSGIRETFRERFENIIHQHTAKLSDLGSNIDRFLQNWQSAVCDACPPMWDKVIINMDTGSGGKGLKDALYVRAYGRSEAVEVVSIAYTAWLDGVDSLERLITQLQEKKWTEELDDMDDDDDNIEDLRCKLSEDDPRILHKTLGDDLEQDFRALCEAINVHAKNLQGDDVKDAASAHKSAFLLRVWRGITSRLPSICRDLEFDAPFIPLLQTQVSKTVLRNPILHCHKRISKRLHNEQFQARVLWEGDPQMPVLPSPWTFRLLYETVGSMADFGVDIWTSKATDILKQHIRDSLAPLVKKLPELPTQVNGHDATGNSTVNGRKDLQDPETVSEVDSQDEDDGEKDKDVNDSGNEIADGSFMKNGTNAQPEPPEKSNGNTSNESYGPSERVIRDMKTQRLFDAIYLDYALTVKTREIPSGNPDSDPKSDINILPDLLNSAQSSILDDLKMEDVAQWNRNLDRMRKDAEAYWKRTELLFALLV
ncbi:MAG: hypothetical protein Q9209_003174 [Squamulea sp. 1 TL-2023]